MTSYERISGLCAAVTPIILSIARKARLAAEVTIIIIQIPRFVCALGIL